jgi:hypothetical protein
VTPEAAFCALERRVVTIGWQERRLGIAHQEKDRGRGGRREDDQEDEGATLHEKTTAR